MMGERRVMQEALFYGFSLERHVPDDHQLRRIDRFVALSEVRTHLEPYYSETGCPSIDPELMMRMLKLIGRIRIPEIVANICFGGPNATVCSPLRANRSTRSIRRHRGRLPAEPSRVPFPARLNRRPAVDFITHRTQFVSSCRFSSPVRIRLRPDSSVWRGRRRAAQPPLASGFRCTPRRTCRRPGNLPLPRPKPCRATRNSRCRARTSTHRGRA